MQDLDAALPLIHTHRDQLVAIGEVTPDVSFVLFHSSAVVLRDKPASGFCFFLGGLRFYTEVHQLRCRQREPEERPHTTGAASQGTGPPPVSALDNITLHYTLHYITGQCAGNFCLD